ncbi:NAD-binding protein [Arcticibacterium luteifluviistationis]|uniref:RCK N-terminal domain-containing protein n=1 Tax=Arcticibacterium luteifluviistationis TaxID=1784714 RepID=A0A2Z4G8X2_9BACT|nr:NAD-binding protein [Arcticibacterium luteifluviistationis]AWV97672.1 hypothetical protein DJ013_05635 [Arcticibacterium luteifluviistationis]
MGHKTIALTGHIDLILDDKPIIYDKLRAKFIELLNVNKSIVLLIGKAEGADQIAREIAVELGITIVDLDKQLKPIQGEPSGEYYRRQGEYLVKNATMLIALWDGIFSGKLGGTSDIVKMALDASSEKTIHHLICPRESNHFPVSNFAAEIINLKSKTFNRIPFTVHYSWVQFNTSVKRKSTWWTSLVSNAIKSVQSGLFWIYLLPILLILATLGLGSWGFTIKNPCDTALNHFFNALNLITFDGSVIDGKSNLQIDISRILGLLLVLSAFIYGFYIALEKQRIKLKRRLWRKDFYLISGLTEKSIRLAKNLANHSQVVLIYKNDETSQTNSLVNNDKIITIHADSSSKRILKGAYAFDAKKTFLMDEDETQNIRTAQELDSLSKTEKKTINSLFVHVNKDENRKLLQQTLSYQTLIKSHIFNTEENTVRRLLLLYPPDRFHQNEGTETPAITCVNIIIGWEELSQQLVLAFLRQGHFTHDKKLKIIILCKDSETEHTKFLNNYPLFDATLHEFKSIKQYTWGNIELIFKELPNSSYEWLKEDNSIITSIKKQNIINLYFTFKNSIESSAILDNILPKVNTLKKTNNCNLQAFYFYNFPDKSEENQTEEHFNKKAPDVFLKCFGNYRDECSLDYLQNSNIDTLAKLINAKYSGIAIDQITLKENKTITTTAIEKAWLNCSEKDKSSSRQAADHLWVKLRLLWPLINWKFDPITFEPDGEVKNILYNKKNIQIFAEIEHRRWCAEQLLWGYSPITEDASSKAYLEMTEKWNNDKAWKKSQQAELKHIDLVPFEELTMHEIQKDIEQLLAIPEFLRNVIKP